MRGEYLPALATLDKEDKVREITTQGITGTIGWEDGLYQRINMLKGLTYKQAKTIADNLPIMRGAKYTCKILRKYGFKLILVSGGFTVLADRVKEELGFDYALANEPLFKNGLLVGVKKPLRVNSDKAASIKDIMDDLRISKDDIVAVIDGANDLALCNIVGHRIGFKAQRIIKEKCDHLISAKDLRFILPIILEHYKLDVGSYGEKRNVLARKKEVYS